MDDQTGYDVYSSDEDIDTYYNKIANKLKCYKHLFFHPSLYQSMLKKICDFDKSKRHEAMSGIMYQIRGLNIICDMKYENHLVLRIGIDKSGNEYLIITPDKIQVFIDKSIKYGKYVDITRSEDMKYILSSSSESFQPIIFDIVKSEVFLGGIKKLHEFRNNNNLVISIQYFIDRSDFKSMILYESGKMYESICLGNNIIDEILDKLKQYENGMTIVL